MYDIKIKKQDYLKYVDVAFRVKIKSQWRRIAYALHTHVDQKYEELYGEKNIEIFCRG